MGSSVFSIGVSALNAANIGLTTTGHNIANVNTDGYTRQVIKQSAPYPQVSGSGYTGLGVRVDTVTRVYDQFLTRQVRDTQAKASYYDSYLAHAKEVDNIVADRNAGVSPALQDYFAKVQNVASNPSNPPARNAMLASAQTLVNRFQVFEQRLAEQRSTINGEISNSVSSINALAKQIADINGQIVIASGIGQPPNDLLDQRDAMVKDMNKLVKASTIEQSDGSINVFIGNGQNLVVGGVAFSLGAVPSPSDPQRITVAYIQNNNTIYLPENALAGGQLGGLLDYRTNSLDLAENSLARVALGFAESFNAQQKTGMDLNGKMGQNLFDYQRATNFPISLGSASINVSAQSGAIPSSDFSLAYDSATTNYTLTRISDKQTQVITNAQMTAGFTAFGVTVQSATAPAASGTAGLSFPPALGSLVPDNRNTGTATLSGYISDISKLSSSDYQMVYDGANYTLTRLSDQTKTVSATLPVNVDGMAISLAGGTPAVGDRFTIKPTSGFINSLNVRITDSNEIAAAMPIRLSSNTANTGSATLTQPEADTPATTTTNAAANPALRNPVNIQFTSANAFDVTDTVTGVTTSHAYVAGMTLSVNGWSLKVTGTPALGDKFSIGANTSGNSDGSNALKMASLQTTRLLSGGTATFQESYGQMVSTIGVQTSEASIMAKAQGTMLEQAETSRDSVSGVNQDEEAANLLRYQQAYMAASKVIQIAQKAFETIVNIGS